MYEPVYEPVSLVTRLTPYNEFYSGTFYPNKITNIHGKNRFNKYHDWQSWVNCDNSFLGEGPALVLPHLPHQRYYGNQLWINLRFDYLIFQHIFQYFQQAGNRRFFL